MEPPHTHNPRYTRRNSAASPGVTYSPAPDADAGIPPQARVPIYVLPQNTTPPEVLLQQILEATRENRSFQMAVIQQQNTLINHLDHLNRWVAGDRQSFLVGLRGVSARVDQIRDDLNRVQPGRHRRQPVVIPPSGSVRSSHSLVGEQQIPVPQGTPGYPPGFVPQYEQPIQPATVPSPSNSSGLQYTPIIPPRPAGW